MSKKIKDQNETLLRLFTVLNIVGEKSLKKGTARVQVNVDATQVGVLFMCRAVNVM